MTSGIVVSEDSQVYEIIDMTVVGFTPAFAGAML
jgi:hypothetical protein